MASTDPNGSGGEDWRLSFELDVSDAHGALQRMLGRVRKEDSAVVEDIEASVPAEVVVTHDGSHLFAYAADEATVGAARSAIEEVLRRDGVAFSVYTSRWDGDRDEWQQTDPPLSADQQRAAEAADRVAEAIETRTLVATSGKLVRAEFEETMTGWAEKLGLECQIVEHPHLLSTQVAFTVKGPKRKVDEFSDGLRAEGWMHVRTEGNLMAGPL